MRSGKGGRGEDDAVQSERERALRVNCDIFGEQPLWCIHRSFFCRKKYEAVSAMGWMCLGVPHPQPDKHHDCFASLSCP